MKTARIAIAALVATLACGAAAAGDAWIHVKIDGGPGAENLEINLPLSFVESMVPAIEDENLRGGKLYLDRDEVDAVRLRQFLVALRDAPDSEFVTLRDRDDAVRVAKERGYLLIHVDGRRGGDERVRVRVPMPIVEALVADASDDGALDVVGALRALARHPGEELVTVEDGGQTIRIWIDERSEIAD